jgi:uncharacterized phage protein gp47/JayE
MSFGLVPTGFTAKTYNDAKTEIEASFRAAFGENIDLDPASFFGQMTAIFAEREAVLWDLAQGVYSAQDPDQATGAALEQIAALTGTVRLPATSSAVFGVAIGTNGTLLSAGRVASVVGTGVKFATSADATIATLPAWSAAHVYAKFDLVQNDTGKVYCATIGGASAGSGGPTGTGTAITDNGVTWRYCGAGTAAVLVALASQDTGPKLAAAGTLTTIETPVGGWSSFVNPLDATPGRDVETDSALRLRREDELRATGRAPPRRSARTCCWSMASRPAPCSRTPATSSTGTACRRTRSSA